MSYRALLDKSVDVKRETLTTDSQGGYTRTWTTVYRRVPCRFNAHLGRESALVYDKPTVLPSYYVYLEYLDINEGDRLYLGSRIFVVKFVANWDEQNNLMTVVVTEADHG